jgi:hypothetical protein
VFGGSWAPNISVMFCAVEGGAPFGKATASGPFQGRP